MSCAAAVVRGQAESILADVRELSCLDLPPSEKIRRITRSRVRVLEEHFTYCSVYLDEVAGRHRFDEWSAVVPPRGRGDRRSLLRHLPRRPVEPGLRRSGRRSVAGAPQ